ncbi:MAG: hypothetical protein IPN73_07020 [Saprospiraceae bacterium]|nr:hypothetical protein [Saprospiraceae bacterium]MBK7787927.1 hypothetical protein [Saprospiraceae bacterium]MBK8849901.1 hypothetical protein [Saprospiraceae bacterium]MBK9686963.1 hypothetical protein [Saprospiraceae bacterium]
MVVRFKDRNVTGELIAFVKKGISSFYCIADVEYFIGEYWNSYLKSTNIEGGYFEFLKRFKVDYYSLHDEYQTIIGSSDDFDLLGNIPKIYIDFDRKYFASYFQEQELELRVAEGWKGEYTKIGNLIPNEFKYWNPYTSEWI